MKILKKISACCAVVALHYVSGIEEETVLRTCLLHGFIEGAGMEDYEWQAAADDLGIKIRHVSIEPQRLKVFLKNHANGLYLLGTRDHLFVIDNGVIIDPREKLSGRYPGLGRIVRQAWKVLK